MEKHKPLKTAKIMKAKHVSFISLLIFIMSAVLIIAFFFYPRTIITVERTMCFGTCPAYRLNIYGDGKVVYEGRHYVQVEGTQITYIPKSKVRELVGEFERIGFYEFEDHYAIAQTDMPSVLVSINFEGKSKTIDVYGGGAPEELMKLINQIEEAANVARWVGE